MWTFIKIENKIQHLGFTQRADYLGRSVQVVPVLLRYSRVYFTPIYDNFKFTHFFAVLVFLSNILNPPGLSHDRRPVSFRLNRQVRQNILLYYQI